MRKPPVRARFCFAPSTKSRLSHSAAVPRSGLDRMQSWARLPTSSFAQPSAFPHTRQQPLEALQRGQHIAQLVCSACHVVAHDQEFPPILRPPAPSFEEFANRPNMSLQTVQRFVLQTHWDMKTLPMQMPAQMLPKSDTTAVARHVLSFRKRRDLTMTAPLAVPMYSRPRCCAEESQFVATTPRS